MMCCRLWDMCHENGGDLLCQHHLCFLCLLRCLVSGRQW